MSDVLFDVRATHERTGPVFVVGYARSGTSIVCRLMRRYLKVSFGTESQFILRYERLLSTYGDLEHDDNARRLLDDLASERFFTRTHRNWGFAFDPAAALADARTRTYPGLLDAVFRQLARHNGMTRWGDKTPQYSADLPALLRLFPDAQFVHAVRDGRDVALSIARTAFGPKNAAECAEDWAGTIERIRAFGRTLPPDRFHEVPYEALTSAPTETLLALGRFLGVRDDTGTMTEALRTRAPGDVLPGNCGKWKHHLHPRELERFEGLAGEMLMAQGYPLALDGQARRLTPFERRLWRWHGAAVRYGRRDAWQDTLYRARLRATMLARQFGAARWLRRLLPTPTTPPGARWTSRHP